MLLIYLYHTDPYSDLWKRDLYFRPTVFNVYGPCINIRLQILWHMQSITWLVPPSKLLFMNSSCLTSRTFAGSWMTWRRLLFSRLHTWRNRDLDSYMYKEKFIMTVFCQVIWKWHSKMIIITCKLKEHQWYTNVQNFYIQNLTCVKHASHEFIHQSYTYNLKRFFF